MKFVTDLSKGVLGTPDSPILWANIISNVPDSLLLKPDFRCLVVACGHCTEAILLVKRMQSLGIPNSRIQDAIWVLDKYSVFTNQARKYGFKNIITADFLLWDPKGMKFDLVMGNPPYQDATKKGSYNAIWQKFVLKGFSILTASGQAAFISPQTWFTQSRINAGNEIAKVQKIIFDYADVINTKDVSHFFPGIGSSFSYYVISKTPNRECLINGKASPRKLIHQTLMDFGNLLIEKLLSFPLFDRASDASSKGTVSDSSSTTHIFPVLTSQKRNDWTDKKSRYHNIPKAIFLVRTSYNFPVIDDKGDLSPPSGSVSSTYLLPDSQQRQIFRGLFDSKLFKFLIGGQRKHHGFLSMRTVASLPYLDLTRTWTDQELYAHFGLTDEEIRYIEEQVK